MKKIYTILSTLLLFGSCNYLDVEPVGKVIPESITDFRAMMTSAYSKIPAYKRVLTVRGDEVVPYNFGPFFDSFVDVALWNDNGNNPVTVDYSWTEMYNVIFYANHVIGGVMDASADTREDSREQLKGEALLLRAFMHFELVNIYGRYYNPATAATDKGIPLALKVDIDQEFKRATVEEVYQQVLADIEAGMQLLQVGEQPATTRYRFSTKAAKALKAKVLLFKMEWGEALQAAQELLPACTLSDLNTDLNDMIPPYYFNSVEAILSMDGVGIVDMVGDMAMNPEFLNHYNQGKVGNVFIDRRLEVYYKEGYDGSLLPDKYSYSKGERATFRSAEIWLIAAEAAAHDPSKLDLAKEYLRTLLEKRLESGYYALHVAGIAGMNQEQLLAEILNERGRELALEGHRWYDLRRTTRPRIEKTFMDANFEDRHGVLEKDDARYTVAIPRSAVENNPNLAY